MRSFRTGELMILIATDVSARGIDIPDVEYVVNYDLPESSEQYVHRVGRTGRANKRGQAVSFCSIEEQDLLKEIEENLGKPIKRIEISKNDYESTVNFSEDKTYNWKTLMKEEEEYENKRKKKKRKK